MLKRDLPAFDHVRRRFALILFTPLLVLAGLSIGCNAEQFKYGEHFRATEEFVSAQSTSYAQTVRSDATSEAPALSATATAIAVAAMADAPEGVRNLFERTGIAVVDVPAGDFLFGTDLPDAGKSASTVWLDDFWIGLTEVTNVQYAAFVDAGGYDDASLWTDEGWQWREKQTYGGPICGGNEAFNAPEQPVTCVNLYEAQAFAALLSRESGLTVRLPTAEEWEKAARGSQGFRYPWGDDPPNAGRANYAAALGQTAGVGSHPEGASPYGALDMAGNVAESTGTRSSFGDQYTVRGGSWFDYADSLISSYNRYYAPEDQQNFNGFRVAVEGE